MSHIGSQGITITGPWVGVTPAIAQLQAAYTDADFQAANVLSTGYVRLGLAPGSGAGSAASVGAARLPYGATVGVNVRNRNDTGDLGGLTGADYGGNNAVWVGGPYPARPDFTMLDAVSYVGILMNGSQGITVNSTGLQLFSNIPIIWSAPSVAPRITQIADATVGVAADDLGIIAQSATGGGASVGGSAFLQPGTGATNGAAELRDAAGAVRLVCREVAAGPIVFYPNGGWFEVSGQLLMNPGAMRPSVPTIEFAPSVVAPTLAQSEDTTVGVTADDLGVIAQSATGGGASVGGSAFLQPGTGATNGAAELRNAAGTAQLSADDVGANLLYGLTASATEYTSADSPLTIPQGVIVCALNTTGGAIAATLPSAAANRGQIVVVKDDKSNFGAAAATLASAAGDTIDNVDTSAGTGTPLTLGRPNQALWLQSNGGTNWRVLADY